MTMLDEMYPRTWKIRGRSNGNLTSVRGNWTIYGERWNVKMVIVFLAVLSYVLLFVASNRNGLLFIGGFLFLTLGWSLFGFAMYWDDLAWVGPKVKPGDYEARPWRPNLRVWYRAYPIVPVERRSLSDVDSSAERPETEAYGISFAGDPEGYWKLKPDRAWPTDSDVFVAPIVPAGDPVVSGRGNGGHGIGTGYMSGAMYHIRGEPSVYFLGRDGLSDAIRDPRLRRMLDGLPSDVREEVYNADAKSKWFRRVYLWEHPGDPVVREKDPDARILMDNKALRALAAQRAMEIEDWQERYLDAERMIGKNR